MLKYRGTIAFVVCVLCALAASSARASITRVNWDSGHKDDTDNNLPATWSQATVAGNLLVATVAVRGGSGTTITPPAGKGWTLAKRSDNGTQVSVAIYYIKNAASQSGTSTWTVSGNAKGTLTLIEYDGVDITSPVDLTVASSGTGTTCSTGSGTPVSEASELAVGIVSAVTTPNFSNLTTGFNKVDTEASQGNPDSSKNKSETYQELFTGAGTITASVDINSSQDWAGALVTFKAASLYWIGSTAGTFTDTTRWAVTSGGTSVGAAPATDDTVVFDGNGTGNCSMSANTQVDSIELKSTYTGTVTLAASKTLLLSHDLTVGGGTFTAGGGAIDTNGQGSYKGDLNVTGGILNGGGSAITVRYLNVSGGTYNTGSGLLNVKKDTTISGGTVSMGGTVHLETGSGVYTQSAGTFQSNANALTISNGTTVSGGTLKAAASGSLTLQGTLDVTGSSALVDANGGTVTISNTTTVSAGNLKASSAGTVDLNGNLAISGGTVDANGGTIDASGGAVTLSSGAFNGTSGTVTLNTMTVSGGTFDNVGGATTANGLVTVSGGTYKVGSGTNLMKAGMTVSSGTLNMTSDSGQLQIGNAGVAQTLTISGGTLTVTGTTQANYPLITRGPSATVNYTFTISSGTLNLNGLQVQRLGANGMNVTGTSVTFTTFKNVRFSNNTGATQHLAIARGAIPPDYTLNAPGCAFDNTATSNVTATATSATSKTFYLYFEQVKGLGYESDSHDSDGDASPDNGTVDAYGTNASLIQWTYAQATDTAGAAVGFPGAAFDWNTFSFYSVYATFTGTAANTDSVYVRSLNGTAVSHYDINTTTYGTIVGTPRWDSVTESAGFDVNGNGMIDVATVHVIYLATSKGYIIKLVDSSGVLSLPGAGSIWNSPFPTGAPAGSTTVKTITSPVVSDGVNLYFAGTNSSDAVTLFGVQIASGGTSCNGNINGRTTQEECAKTYSLGGSPTSITAALAWAKFSGDTYLYVASTSKVYRYDVTTNLLSASYTTVGSGAINGALRYSPPSRLFGTDDKGHVYNLYGDPSQGSGSFTNQPGYYYTVTGTPALSTPYLDTTTNSAYFGDSAGKVYKLDTNGVLQWSLATGLGTISAAPLYISGNSYLIAGDTAGKVAYVLATGPTLKYTLTLSGSISAISYNSAANSNAGEIMVTTSTGGLYYLPKVLP